MSTLWHNLIGWLLWLAQGDHLTLAFTSTSTAVLAVVGVLQRLGLTRAADKLTRAHAQLAEVVPVAQKATTTTVVVLRGLEEASARGHLDAETLAKVRAIIEATADEWSVREHLAPIAEAVRADLPPTEIVRAAGGFGIVPVTDGGPPPPSSATAPPLPSPAPTVEVCPTCGR